MQDRDGAEAAAAAAAPLVSVVMATFDRSNIIGYSIRALLASALTDWELIVVGDACTDDTAEVVAAFGDPRIRYLSLRENCGEQSGPNNAGVAQARGRYLAFLNHDDLWLPHHLGLLVQALEQEATDLVFSVGLAIIDEGRAQALVGATTRTGAYHTALSPPASLWLMRRELAERIGPWRSAFALRVAPSQDWLHRAHRDGARLRALPKLTALLLTSGGTRDSYRARREEAHALYFARLQDPDFIVDALLLQLLAWEDARLHDGGLGLLAEGLRAVGRHLLRRLGIFPSLPSQWLRFWRRGSFIRSLRRTRGLPERPPSGPGALP